jgi:hypothetical protein
VNELRLVGLSSDEARGSRLCDTDRISYGTTCKPQAASITDTAANATRMFNLNDANNHTPKRRRRPFALGCNRCCGRVVGGLRVVL